MDKSTLSNYGWIVIAVLVLAVMIALATPFGSYIKTGVENTTEGLFDISEKAMNVVGMSAKNDNSNSEMSAPKVSIFQTYNLADNGTFEYSFTGTQNNTSSTAVITPDVYNSLGHSYKFFDSSDAGKSNVFTKFPLVADEYYVACKIRVDRYEKGYAGVLVNNGGNNNYPVIQITQTTDNKFITASGTFTTNGASNLNIFYGTFDSANLDCYIDDLVIIPLSAFETKPSITELDKQYEDYISYRSIEIAQDEQYVSAFMDKVNQKAQSLGMTNSTFGTPSGFIGATQYTTAEDMMKLVVAAYRNEAFNDFWSNAYREITIDGYRNRTVSLEGTYADYIDAVNYPILGCKTGSLSGYYNIVAVTEINGETVIGVVSSLTDDRYSALNELFTICENVLLDPTYDTSSVTVNAKSAIACVLTNDSYDVLFEKDKTTKFTQASLTKIITILTAMDYIDNFETNILIKENDATEGSGTPLYAGDTISYKNLFYEMMLPSSNTAATALARNIGAVISN